MTVGKLIKELEKYPKWFSVLATSKTINELKKSKYLEATILLLPRGEKEEDYLV